MKWLILVLALCSVPSVAYGQPVSEPYSDWELEILTKERKAKLQSNAELRAKIDVLLAELSALRQELIALKEGMERLSAKPVVIEPIVPTRKVWKQVRQPVQIEGMIDDGYELVEEPIRRKGSK